MKTRKTLTVIVLILLLATLTFIFSNSLEPVAKSSKKSQDITDFVAPRMPKLSYDKGTVTDHLVRKTAHFAESCALGIELMLLLILRRRVHFQSIANCLFISLAAAVTDESLQMLTDRSPLVKDILLDFSGALTGVMLILLIKLILTSKQIHDSSGRF